MPAIVFIISLPGTAALLGRGKVAEEFGNLCKGHTAAQIVHPGEVLCRAAFISGIIQADQVTAPGIKLIQDLHLGRSKILGGIELRQGFSGSFHILLGRSSLFSGCGRSFFSRCGFLRRRGLFSRCGALLPGRSGCLRQCFLRRNNRSTAGLCRLHEGKQLRSRNRYGRCHDLLPAAPRVLDVQGQVGRSFVDTGNDKKLIGVLRLFQLSDPFGRILDRDAVLGKFIRPTEGTGLDNAVSIDGAKIITHRDDVESVLSPFRAELFSLLDIAVIAHIIIRDEHEGSAAVRIVIDRVIVHADITAGIAEGEHRLLADIAHDLLDLVHLQVLDEQSVRAHELIIGLEDIVQSVRVALVGSLVVHIHADNVVIGNIEHALDEGTADGTVTAADDIDLEIVILQILDNLNHRGIEGCCITHPLKAVGRTDKNACHKVGKFLRGQAGIGAGSLNGVTHGHIRCEGMIDHRLANLAAQFKHLGIRGNGRILQDAPGQHIVFQIGREELCIEGAVHVKHGNAVFHRDVVGRRLIRDRRDIIDQGVQRRGIRVPVCKDILFHIHRIRSISQITGRLESRFLIGVRFRIRPYNRSRYKLNRCFRGQLNRHSHVGFNYYLLRLIRGRLYVFRRDRNAGQAGNHHKSQHKCQKLLHRSNSPFHQCEFM